VKAKLSNAAERPQELEVIDSAIGNLPPHVKLVYPETELSTYSLFEIADYAVTVRGTVGIESALFGIPVVTAGTGRYSGRGFTLDSSTRHEYLERLAALETYPRLSAEQTELAERFAYGALLCCPLTLSSLSLEYERDAVATQKLTIRCRTRDEWLAAPDMQQLSAWIADGKAEDLLVTS
jgi:Capsule polysaccharide biosynthesis protein